MSLIAVPFHLDESLDGFALSRLDSTGRTIRIELPYGSPFDPAELPGLRFPVPDGARREELARAVAAVLATGRVAAIGLACTWWPDRLDRARADAIVQQLLEIAE